MPNFGEVIKGTNGTVAEYEDGETGIEHLGSVTGEGYSSIIKPFAIRIVIEGTSDLLFHRYSVDAVQEKADAPKGSDAKKTDDIESYVWRDRDNRLCMPATYLHRAMEEAGRSHKDPRSPRKMAMELVRASLLVTPNLTPLRVKGEEITKWDYIDRQRVTVNHAAIPRSRPALNEGWQCTFEIKSLQPHYLTRDLMRKLVDDAGAFIGLADYRPQYGRFNVVSWEPVKD